MSDRDVVEIVDRWLSLIALLNGEVAGVRRDRAARAIACNERTLRRDIERMNDIAGTTVEGLPFAWPRVGTRLENRRAVLYLESMTANDDHTPGDPVDATEPVQSGPVTTISLRVRHECALARIRAYPGFVGVAFDSERVAPIATLRCPISHDLVSWLVGLGREVEVLSPVGLRSRLFHELRETLSFYEP